MTKGKAPHSSQTVDTNTNHLIAPANSYVFEPDLTGCRLSQHSNCYDCAIKLYCYWNEGATPIKGMLLLSFWTRANEEVREFSELELPFG